MPLQQRFLYLSRSVCWPQLIMAWKLCLARAAAIYAGLCAADTQHEMACCKSQGGMSSGGLTRERQERAAGIMYEYQASPDA